MVRGTRQTFHRYAQDFIKAMGALELDKDPLNKALADWWAGEKKLGLDKVTMVQITFFREDGPGVEP